MSSIAIPPWTPKGVLPPINASQPASPDRSPYMVSLTDYVQRFGNTSKRRTIIDGLIRYRAALHAAGLDSGFQWLDGSFLEHVEQMEGRDPNDIDVVTFFRLPDGRSQEDVLAKAGRLFDNRLAKDIYRVDGYFVHLGMAPEMLIRKSAYWYSVWSHRRNQLWKGFVQIDLAPTEDVTVATTLASLSNSGGGS